MKSLTQYILESSSSHNIDKLISSYTKQYKIENKFVPDNITQKNIYGIDFYDNGSDHGILFVHKTKDGFEPLYKDRMTWDNADKIHNAIHLNSWYVWMQVNIKNDYATVVYDITKNKLYIDHVLDIPEDFQDDIYNICDMLNPTFQYYQDEDSYGENFKAIKI